MKIRNPRILILGHGRHGKDSLAEEFRSSYDLKFSSSSYAAAKIFLFDKLKHKYGYKTFDECYADRHNRRAEWHDEISSFNNPDKARLAKRIMEKNDIYVGMRSNDEIEACKKEGVFDVVLWVYRPGFPLESEDSFNIGIGHADFVIFNDGSVEDLKMKARDFMNYWISSIRFRSSWMTPIEATHMIMVEKDAKTTL